MAVHATAAEAVKRAESMLGRIGLPQPWADFGQRAKDSEYGTVNDCCYFFTWCVKDNGGRVRSDYRNGSIRALRADRGWTERSADATPKPGDGILLRWEATGLPDHIGIVTSVNRNGSVNTIEANTGPSVGVYVPTGVHRRTRFRQNIVGFVVPTYL
jgi:hypothetical protein